MSRAKEIKMIPENNINLFELFSLLVPQRKTKYTETLLRLMKKTAQIDNHVEEIKVYLESNFMIDRVNLDSIPKLQLVIFYRILDTMFNTSDLESFRKFCDYNERNLIKQNDLSRYNSFEDLMNALNVADIINDTKDLEKQVKVVYENEEWLLIRPLTFMSSKKYGSNTKWCTTTESNPEYFLKYSKKGVLIYCINKMTGYKVASFYSLDKNDPEFSFWDQKDNRVDSLDTELTNELRDIILKESKTIGSKTNRFLLSDEEREKEERILNISDNVRNIGGRLSQERNNYIRRAVERAHDELVSDENDYLLTSGTTRSIGTIIQNDLVPLWNTTTTIATNGTTTNTI